MNWNTEEHKVKTIFYWLAIVVLVLVIVGMISGYIDWKTAIGTIKRGIQSLIRR